MSHIYHYSAKSVNLSLLFRRDGWTTTPTMTFSRKSHFLFLQGKELVSDKIWHFLNWNWCWQIYFIFMTLNLSGKSRKCITLQWNLWTQISKSQKGFFEPVLFIIIEQHTTQTYLHPKYTNVVDPKTHRKVTLFVRFSFAVFGRPSLYIMGVIFMSDLSTNDDTS